MGDLRTAKSRPACGGAVGVGDTSSAAAASRMIIAQWAARRRQAYCDQMVALDPRRDRDRDRDSELLALARLHAVSTMLDASSFLRGAHDDDHNRGDRRSPERALVRRIAREWTAPPPPQQETSSPRSGSSGEEWLGETERERVRSVRERVRRASQGNAGAHTEVEQSATSEPGRQTQTRRRADVAARMAMERQRELQGLSEHRAVSAFAHRGHIQSFLRGRFFHSGRRMHDERPISMAARDLGQLVGQSHPVTAFREEIGSTTENFTNDQASNRSGSTGAQNSSTNSEHHRRFNTDQVFPDSNYHLQFNAAQDSEIQMFQSPSNNSVDAQSIIPNSNNVARDDFNDQEQDMHGYEEYSDSGSSEQGSEQSGSSSSSLVSDSSAQQEDLETYGQQPADLQWTREITVGEDGEGGDTFLHRDEDWHVIDSQEAEPQWQSGPSFSSSRHINRFSPPDDDVYGVELRELLSRRSVSNLLSSGFRESLDQLIQSYAQRQEHDDPLDWNYERQIPAAAATGLLNQDHVVEHGGIDESSDAEHDAAAPEPPSIVLSGQALGLPHHNWSQQAMQHTEFDCEAIHLLRDDLTGLQRGMMSMQQMLEACMEMQVELQRSIRQEVSAALNRSTSMIHGAGEEDDGSQWKVARKGTCCVCCDNQIDSLLYRCGHMCTCSKCAGELLHGGAGKCPLCRAPIVEVIRAYCII